MCLIIYKPDNQATFSPESMTASVSRNSDGVGVMYLEDGRVKTDKLVFEPTDKTRTSEQEEQEYADFCNTYLQSKEKVVIHHRFKTHGKIDYPNTHPYRVLNIDEGDLIDLYMMHNGTLSFGSSPDYSDTYHFVEEVLRPILSNGNEHLLYREEFKKLLNSTVKGSKLVFLDSYGQVTIINEDDGKWQEVKDGEGGCWISNTYSLQKKHVYTSPYYSTYHTRGSVNAGGSAIVYDMHGDDDYEYPNAFYPRNTPAPIPKPSMNNIIAKAKATNEDGWAVPPTFKGNYMRYYFTTGTEKVISDQEYANPTEEGRGDIFWDYVEHNTQITRATKAYAPTKHSELPWVEWDTLSVDECVDLLTHTTTSVEDIEDFVKHSPHTKVVQVIDVLSAEVVNAQQDINDDDGGQEDEELLACAI